MTDRDKSAVTILVSCKTLAVADRQLADLYPRAAIRWGVYDGWSSRPESIAGLTSELHPDVAVSADYARGRLIGMQLRRSVRRARRVG
jgi:hypothetical protein